MDDNLMADRNIKKRRLNVEFELLFEEMLTLCFQESKSREFSLDGIRNKYAASKINSG
jgi:hypothetical protein